MFSCGLTASAKWATAGRGAFPAAFYGHGRALRLRCYDLAASPCFHFTHTPISPIHRLSPISPIGFIGPSSATNTPKLRNEPKHKPPNPNEIKVSGPAAAFPAPNRTQRPAFPLSSSAGQFFHCCLPGKSPCLGASVVQYPWFFVACFVSFSPVNSRKSSLIKANPAKKLNTCRPRALTRRIHQSPPSVHPGWLPSGQVRPNPAIQNHAASRIPFRRQRIFFNVICTTGRLPSCGR